MPLNQHNADHEYDMEPFNRRLIVTLGLRNGKVAHKPSIEDVSPI